MSNLDRLPSAPPPPGVVADFVAGNSSAPAIQGSTSATWALAFISVVLRFVARRSSKAGLWYDDWLIIPALICGFGLWYDSAIWMVDHGLGQRIYVVTIQKLILFQKGFYISEVLWTASLTFVKLSVLLFYFRLFKQRRTPRWVIQLLLGAAFSWGTIIIFVTIFQCKPVSKFWDPSTPGTCVTQIYELSMGGAITHVVIDVLILAAPIPMIWALQLRLPQKLMLSGIFGLGIFTTVVSGIRLNYLIRFASQIPDDITMNLTDIAIWTSVEVNTAVICACLPCLRPIGSLLVDKLKALRERTKSARQGKDLLVDMLPRRRQGQDTRPILPDELPETTTSRLRDSNPRELDTTEQPMPEMAAIECGPLELESGVAASELRTNEGRYSLVEFES